jgi:hypothetical protein
MKRARPKKQPAKLSPSFLVLNLLLQTVVAEYADANGLPRPASDRDFWSMLADALLSHPDLESYTLRTFARRLAGNAATPVDLGS